MSTVIHLNVAALDDVFVRDLKDQFGTADMELRISKQPANWMTCQQFWDLIALLDWSKTGDDAAVVEPLLSALAAMPVANIHQFEDTLSEALWQLDTRAFALASVGVSAEAKAKEGNDPEAYISDDGFLYDRCCVVANGKAFFEAVLRDPQQFPVGVSFEALLYVAGDAYRRKTGRDFRHIPTFNYETGSNTAGWPTPDA